MYTLGIDTTFHKTAIALVDKNNRVKINKTIDIDFFDHDADKFLNSHIRNLLNLLALLDNSYWKKIDLIAVVNKEGAFHSLPIGVTSACVLGLVKNKRIIGVDHEIAHLYSNWLERNDKDFEFPISTLSISGAHSAVYLQESHDRVIKLGSILWGHQKDSFPGIAALFDIFCRKLKINIQTSGEGGILLADLARKRQETSYPEVNKIKIRYSKNTIIIFGAEEAIEQIRRKYQKILLEQQFQQNISYNFLNHIFGLLAQGLIKFARRSNARELHLVGGVAANFLFRKIIKQLSYDNGLIFKSPVKKEYCGDNAAMVAVRGKYKSIFEKESNILSISPSQWYYNYYCKYHLTGGKR